MSDLAGPLAGLLVKRLGSRQHGLIDRLVGGHQQELGLIVILTISKFIFIVYLYCLLAGQGGEGGIVGGWRRIDWGMRGKGVGREPGGV